MIRVFVQARMSSERFPGKVLAPFRGQPVIAHVIAQVSKVITSERIVVATSAEQSDDPLACYVRSLGISVFRGSLNDVIGRLQSCLRENPCSWFFRVCADSPLIGEKLFQTMSAYSDRLNVDLVTNVYPRTFPKGQSLEMISSVVFAGLDSKQLTSEDKEHVTKVYYDSPDKFRIVNIESGDSSQAARSLAIDTPEDLRNLEELLGKHNPSLGVAYLDL